MGWRRSPECARAYVTEEIASSTSSHASTNDVPAGALRQIFNAPRAKPPTSAPASGQRVERAADVWELSFAGDGGWRGDDVTAVTKRRSWSSGESALIHSPKSFPP